MLNNTDNEVSDFKEAIENFKIAVSEELTPYALLILFDPEYGLPASESKIDDNNLKQKIKKAYFCQENESGYFNNRIKELGI